MASKYLKMYILIDEDIDVGHAVNSAAHAGAMIDSRWPKDDPIMAEWYSTSFRKVTCKCNDKELENAKQYDDWFAVTEMAFDNDEVALVFKPRKKWPKCFNYFRLYK